MTVDCRAIAEDAVQRGALQKVEELARFLELISGLNPRVIVEIGTFDGATVWAWQQVAPVVVGIDHSPRLKVSTTATMIVGDSHDPATVAKLTEHLAGAPIDVLFLDGDHSYDGIRQDYSMYRPLVRAGGVIAVHDIAAAAPSAGEEAFYGALQFWTEVRNGDAVEIIDSTPGSGGRWGDAWGGFGIIAC